MHTPAVSPTRPKGRGCTLGTQHDSIPGCLKRLWPPCPEVGCTFLAGQKPQPTLADHQSGLKSFLLGGGQEALPRCQPCHLQQRNRLRQGPHQNRKGSCSRLLFENLNTKGKITCGPGKTVALSIPSLSRWTTHQFQLRNPPGAEGRAGTPGETQAYLGGEVGGDTHYSTGRVTHRRTRPVGKLHPGGLPRLGGCSPRAHWSRALPM